MKRENKTKEQLIEEGKQIEETKRKRAIVKEQLYPILLAESLNIDDAKNMCVAASSAIVAAFNKQMLSQLVEDLGIKVNADEKNDKHRKVLAVFENETVFVAKDLLEGCVQAIESFQREESTKRKLDTLKADLL